jgi:hypothetical protein
MSYISVRISITESQKFGLFYMPWRVFFLILNPRAALMSMALFKADDDCSTEALIVGMVDIKAHRFVTSDYAVNRF